MPPPIEGRVAPGFEPVADAFAENFGRVGPYAEIGASLAVYRRGECVVDLWGGHADRAATRPWQQDTLVNLWSTTKAAAAFCIALLVERGRLDYDDRVAACWPAFAAAGKQATTVAHLLSHQAGLPGFAEPTSIDDLFDHDRCAARLAGQAALWTPGTANGYHAVTYGFLASELVRRVDGRTLGRFLADELAGPLGADFYIGVDSGMESRIAELVPPDRPADMSAIEMNAAMMLALGSPAMDPHRANARDWRTAELPALNGHGSAQGIARLYAAMLDPAGPCSPATMRRMTAIAADRDDLVLGFNPGWGMGVAHNGTGM
ncbi:serine hydrolase domain-containing protein, partial [Sphingopyxis sp.]|uniref:serine hydrolase domain-containing protein n=1 Tax=Sphingopyxis sp. TaxID=1908224 RepID=UPI002EDA948E